MDTSRGPVTNEHQSAPLVCRGPGIHQSLDKSITIAYNNAGNLALIPYGQGAAGCRLATMPKADIHGQTRQIHE
jgi:hypothetical protein